MTSSCRRRAASYEGRVARLGLWLWKAGIVADPSSPFQTGRATGINSDAKYRFERGVDPGFVVPGIELATQLVLALCGGTPSEVTIAGAAPKMGKAVAFNPDHVRTLAGVEVPAKRQTEILESLGFSVSGAGNALQVTPPSWRRDVEGSADLVEEVEAGWRGHPHRDAEHTWLPMDHHDGPYAGALLRS